MNVAEIKTNDIANGEGVRTSLFVSGCRHHCPDCFNYMAWDFEYGREWSEETENYILDSVKPPWIAGISILGGEPFEPENQQTLLDFLKKFKKDFPNKTVWCYSGFTFEEITGAEKSRAFTDISKELLEMTDILVDGKFIKELKNISLKFRGSENQRVIDVKKTLEAGKIILYLK
ncbi:MAG: anaerobic ribonucleoside-triphosphate reductase activating protein [Eubacterium sp.]